MIETDTLPSKSGDLKKKGKVWTAWRSRQFVLREGILSYYKPTSATPAGRIILNGNCIACVHYETGYPFCIMLKTFGRDYIFSAETEKVRDEWLKELQTTIEMIRSSKTTASPSSSTSSLKVSTINTTILTKNSDNNLSNTDQNKILTINSTNLTNSTNSTTTLPQTQNQNNSHQGQEQEQEQEQEQSIMVHNSPPPVYRILPSSPPRIDPIIEKSNYSKETRSPTRNIELQTVLKKYEEDETQNKSSDKTIKTVNPFCMILGRCCIPCMSWFFYFMLYLIHLAVTTLITSAYDDTSYVYGLFVGLELKWQILYCGIFILILSLILWKLINSCRSEERNYQNLDEESRVSVLCTKKNLLFHFIYFVAILVSIFIVSIFTSYWDNEKFLWNLFSERFT